MNRSDVLTSVVSYPERGSGGNSSYRGNCSPKLVEDLIRHFSPKEVCDYMSGSGTTRGAATQMGINSQIYDLHSGFDLLNHEIPERPEFIFWHPPYHDIIVYSDNMYDAKRVQTQYGYDPKQVRPITYTVMVGVRKSTELLYDETVQCARKRRAYGSAGRRH